MLFLVIDRLVFSRKYVPVNTAMGMGSAIYELPQRGPGQNRTFDVLSYCSVNGYGVKN